MLSRPLPRLTKCGFSVCTFSPLPVSIRSRGLFWMTVWTLWVGLVGVLPDASMVPSWRRRMVPDTGCLVSTQERLRQPSPSCWGCSPSPAGSAAGMRGGSAAAPAGAPLLGRTRLPFFSHRRLQNAPLVPAVGSGGGCKCQGVGLGYR